MTARATPNALALAKRLGDYFVATDPVYDKAENIRSVGGSYADGFVTCYFSCIEGLVGLGRVTKDQRYLDEAKRIAGLAATVTNFDGLHSHGRLCAVRGFADLYALTGEQRWRDAAERDWQIFASRYLLPTGGVKEMLEDKVRARRRLRRGRLAAAEPLAVAPDRRGPLPGRCRTLPEEPFHLPAVPQRRRRPPSPAPG